MRSAALVLLHALLAARQLAQAAPIPVVLVEDLDGGVPAGGGGGGGGGGVAVSAHSLPSWWVGRQQQQQRQRQRQRQQQQQQQQQQLEEEHQTRPTGVVVVHDAGDGSDDEEKPMATTVLLALTGTPAPAPRLRTAGPGEVEPKAETESGSAPGSRIGTGTDTGTDTEGYQPHTQQPTQPRRKFRAGGALARISTSTTIRTGTSSTSNGGWEVDAEAMAAEMRESRGQGPRRCGANPYAAYHDHGNVVFVGMVLVFWMVCVVVEAGGAVVRSAWRMWRREGAIRLPEQPCTRCRRPVKSFRDVAIPETILEKEAEEGGEEVL